MRPTRKNTLGQTPKLSYAPCDKPLSSQASLCVLFPESILGVFLLFVVVVMYKRIGMSNESILHTTSAALLPLLLKPFAVSMAGRLHISHTATRLGFFLAFVFLLTMGHGIKNAASNIQYFSLFSLAISFCFISNTRPLCAFNAPATATEAPWRKCAISYEIAILALMGGLVMFAGVLEVYTRQPRTSWAVSCVVMAIFLLSLSLYRHFSTIRHGSAEACNRCSFLSAEPPSAPIADKLKHLWHTTCIIVCFLPLFFSLRLLPLFLLDRESAGGLGFSTSDTGLLQGCIAVAGLLVGAAIGRKVIQHYGQKNTLAPMSLLLSLVNAVSILLAYQQFSSLPLVGICLFVACCGVGASSISLLKWQIMVSNNNTQNYTCHADTTTAAAGMILSGLISAYLLPLGYLNAFILLTSLLAPLSFLAASFMRTRLPKETKRETTITDS